jgi:molybdenum-dependent DNA-binding transcriptional regulator ModE
MMEAREYGQVAHLNELQTEYVDGGERRRANVLALVEAKGSISAAALDLGVNPQTVVRWLRDCS